MTYPGECTIRRLFLTVERKTFILDLCENSLGVFLRITEEAGGRRSSVIIPEVGLGEFYRTLGKLMKPPDKTTSAV
jgi:hypothetical protein